MIRWAHRADGPAIVRYIHELAEYERLAHLCHAELARLDAHLFGPEPVCEALVAEQDGEVVGFALFFLAYSTFESGPYLWLEDLYVTPRARGHGHGKALLATLAAIARARGHQRVQWNVLDWNAPAIAFYESLGAQILPDWRTCRVAGEAIAALAAAAEAPPRA
ncbi:MAG: GNAT family N-acetyltransferase [Planctomycetota bacterium]